MRAAAVYAALVFLAGFVLSVIRVLLMAPHVGEAVAVSLEIPIMIVVSWFVCRWCVGWLDVPRRVPARALMGVVAFLILIAAEFSVGAALGRSPADQLSSYGGLAGAIGLTGQITFAIIPIIQVWRR